MAEVMFHYYYYYHYQVTLSFTELQPGKFEIIGADKFVDS